MTRIAALTTVAVALAVSVGSQAHAIALTQTEDPSKADRIAAKRAGELEVHLKPLNLEPLGRFYPEYAYHHRIGGKVKINCLVTDAHTLDDCQPVEETPAGAGLALASVLAMSGRHVAEIDEDGDPTAGVRATVTLTWTPPPR